MKQFKEIESVGWIFWAVSSCLLLIPCYFLSGFLVYEYSMGVRIGLTIAESAIVGAIFAWAVNEILYRRKLAKYKETRKKIRKKKRKNN
ncbi:MAG TPA: hypothetical protein PLX23_05955 [Candidatus Hydrogenedens sp.]|nr:hypothetical protein [Candidatus Hydrogenedens sp.]